MNINETDQNFSIPPIIIPSPNPTTNYPSLHPTLIPTLHPTTNYPTLIPTGYPTNYPTLHPTLSPNINPTNHPTTNSSGDWAWSFTLLIIPALIVTCLTKPNIIGGWVRNIKNCCRGTETNSETSTDESD